MISGGIKFFNKSKCLEIDGASASASNGDSTSAYAIDQNPYTYWYTVGSNDSTTETLTINFNGSQSISRLLLLDHNFKQFTVKYDLLGVFTAFTNVVGMDGALSGITETTVSDNSSYYEFDFVQTTRIQISVTKTQVANSEKQLSQVIATSELGTLAGYPMVKAISIDRNSRIKKTISGKYSVQKSDESTSIDIQFKNYPSVVAYNVDIDLMMALHDLDTPFLVWLCGGRRGTSYFNYTLRGFRLKDVYQMQVTKAYKLSYTSNVYKNPLNCEVTLDEVI